MHLKRRLPNHIDKSTPEPAPSPPLSLYFLLSISGDRKTQKGHSCGFSPAPTCMLVFALKKRKKRFSFRKKLVFTVDGIAVWDRRVSRQAQTSLQEKTEQDFNSRGSIHPSLPPPDPPPPLASALSLSPASPLSLPLSHTHTLIGSK